MPTFLPNGGAVKPPAPNSNTNESVVALPLPTADVDVVRIFSVPANTSFLFGTSSVSFTGKEGIKIDNSKPEFYAIPEGTTHISFKGGGSGQSSINLVTGKMVTP